jgi:hypothetical protein
MEKSLFYWCNLVDIRGFDSGPIRILLACKQLMEACLASCCTATRADRHLKRHLWRVLSFHKALIYITNRKLRI